MIVDSHSHLDLTLPGMVPHPERKREPLGFIWSYENMGFRNPLWRGEPPEAVRILISAENQVRLSMGCRRNLLSFMDSCGIDRAVVLPVEPFSTSSSYAEECATEPRLIPFASCFPGNDWEGKLQRAMEAGCRGLKIHPILQRIPPEDLFYFDLLEAYRKYGRPVITHTGAFDYYVTPDPCSEYGCTPRFERLIAAFPDIPFILGHSGLYHPEQAIDLARRHESVYLETSFQPLKIVREMLRAVGRDRVMFGSDWPETNQKHSLRIAKKAAGDDAELQEKLLGANILALVS
jgi:predicted TIM-barrel fold metal-dependent hydrolase